MKDQKYNGWTNHDTWASHLWLTNDENTYHYAVNIAGNTGMVREQKEMGLQGLLNALGNPDAIDYDNVNWTEVIEALRE